MQRITITRKYLPDRTEGVLLLPDGQWLVTLERPWLGNAHKISCIPEGLYVADRARMASHNVVHYLLQHVPERTEIFIHRGVHVDDSLGCILVGLHLTRDGILTGTTEACIQLERVLQGPIEVEIKKAA
jgi:hypothetical protein